MNAYSNATQDSMVARVADTAHTGINYGQYMVENLLGIEHEYSNESEDLKHNTQRKEREDLREDIGEITDWYQSNVKDRSDNVAGIIGQASGVMSEASGIAANQAAAEGSVQGQMGGVKALTEGVSSGDIKPSADTPDTPTVKNIAKETNMTATDKNTEQAAATGKLPTLSISSDGKTVVNASETNNESDSLGYINQKIMAEVASQQANQTSNDAAVSYQVQTATGETVVLMKNPCYQKTEQKCLQNYTTSWTDANGTYRSEQVPLNTLEYLAGSTKVTADMIQQARRQEAYTQATNDALSGKNVSLNVNPVETVTSAVQDMIAYGADPRQAIFSGLLAYASQLQTSDTLKSVKEYGEGMQAIQKAKDDAVYAKTEEIQQKDGVLSAQKNKRFRPRLIPDIPVINSENPIKVSLITASGKPNDQTQYQVFVTVRNQKTKKTETFEVRENTPFIVELPEWTTIPGRRNVAVTYKFANSAVNENYSFSYKVGQLSTAILPNGKAVYNSVTALASNRDILSYNAMGQAVAGRVKDVKWDNGMCFMEITDAKDDANIKYPSVVVASDKVAQSACGMDLKSKYISMENVTSRVDDNGQYVYVDNSDGDQVRIMNESGYDALEDTIAAETQVQGNRWDKDTLKVSDDGTIYSALPGQLGENYLNINLGSGKKVNIAVSVNPDTQEYMFSKADGTRYTDQELLAKGIDPSVIRIGVNPANSLLTAFDATTGQVVSNNSFDASDTSNLSRSLSDVDTSGGPTRNSIMSGLGETGKAVLGQTISTFSSAINGVSRAVVSLTGNLASIGGGTFASLAGATLGNETPLSTSAKEAAQEEALKVCSTVPDRCEDAMAAIIK